MNPYMDKECCAIVLVINYNYIFILFTKGRSKTDCPSSTWGCENQDGGKGGNGTDATNGGNAGRPGKVNFAFVLFVVL